MSSVDLGFLEKCEAWLLTNKFFPSKVGGRPAWLELQNLPNVKDLKCEHCQNELIFLCQVMIDKISCFFLNHMMYQKKSCSPITWRFSFRYTLHWTSTKVASIGHCIYSFAQIAVAGNRIRLGKAFDSLWRLFYNVF